MVKNLKNPAKGWTRKDKSVLKGSGSCRSKEEQESCVGDGSRGREP